jgi:SAM-dependent methyltransferase
MVIDLATHQEGIVEGEIFTENLSTIPSLKSMIIKKKIGDRVEPTTDLLNSPAKFHLVHEDPGQLERDYEQIQRVGRVGFVVTKEETLLSGASAAAEDVVRGASAGACDIATLWKGEYERHGIPSSYRTEPSSVVSDFFYKFLAERRAPTNVVADIGCGLGRNSLFFAQRGATVYAIDIVAENIAQLQKYAADNGLSIIAVCGDITDTLAIPDKSVDIVMDVFCYKHQVDDKKREFYRRELCRVMKDTGYYLLSLAGKDDGYYGSLSKVGDTVVDPHTGVGSVLFDPEDIRREFDGYIIKKIQTVRKEGVMHKENYLRVTHAFIMQMDLPENRHYVEAARAEVHPR